RDVSRHRGGAHTVLLRERHRRWRGVVEGRLTTARHLPDDGLRLGQALAGERPAKRVRQHVGDGHRGLPRERKKRRAWRRWKMIPLAANPDEAISGESASEETLEDLRSHGPFGGGRPPGAGR